MPAIEKRKRVSKTRSRSAKRPALDRDLYGEQETHQLVGQAPALLSHQPSERRGLLHNGGGRVFMDPAPWFDLEQFLDGPQPCVSSSVAEEQKRLEVNAIQQQLMAIGGPNSTPPPAYSWTPPMAPQLQSQAAAPAPPAYSMAAQQPLQQLEQMVENAGTNRLMPSRVVSIPELQLPYSTMLQRMARARSAHLSAGRQIQQPLLLFQGAQGGWVQQGPPAAPC